MTGQDVIVSPGQLEKRPKENPGSDGYLDDFQVLFGTYRFALWPKQKKGQLLFRFDVSNVTCTYHTHTHTHTRPHALLLAFPPPF